MSTNVTRRRAAIIHERISAAGALLPEVVRRIRSDLRAGVPADVQQFLADVARPDRRYGFTVLERLVDISATHCSTDVGRYALIEALKARVDRRAEASVAQLNMAIDAEDAAQHAADDAVRRYERTKAPTDLELVRETTHAHEVASARLHAVASAMADRGDA